MRPRSFRRIKALLIALADQKLEVWLHPVMRFALVCVILIDFIIIVSAYIYFGIKKYVKINRNLLKNL